MRKTLAAGALLLALAAALTATATATADDKHPSPLPSRGAPTQPVNQPDDDDYAGIVISDDDSAKERRAHHELDLRYGKGGAFQIPPLVIKPSTVATAPNSGFAGAAVTGSNSSHTAHVSIGQTQAPEGRGLKAGVSTKIASQPVDFSKVILKQETPAQTFVHSSSIALLVLAGLAIAAAGYLAFGRSQRARTELADEEFSA